MSVCPLAADVGFLFSCSAAVSAGDVLLLLGFGLDLSLILPRPAFRPASKGNAVHDDGIYVVASELHIIYNLEL